MTDVINETFSSSTLVKGKSQVFEEDAESYTSILQQESNVAPSSLEEKDPATPSRQSINSASSIVSRILSASSENSRPSRIQSTSSENSRVSRIQSINSTDSMLTIPRAPSSKSKKSESSLVQLKSKVVCRIQYIGFSLISMGCAFAVMIIWYTVWLEKNKCLEGTKSTTNTTDARSNNTCPVWDLTGDGYCDDDANIPECGYDFSDCCELENDRSACQNCTCFVSANKIDKFKEKNCDDYVYLTHLGDGVCDLNYNKAEYFFDVGDCCQDHEFRCQDKILDYLIKGLDVDHIDRPCPENPCIKSNNYCIPEELGDGICQDHNNGPFCGYDMGDCCLGNKDECCDCACAWVDSSIVYNLG